MLPWFLVTMCVDGDGAEKDNPLMKGRKGRGRDRKTEGGTKDPSKKKTCQVGMCGNIYNIYILYREGEGVTLRCA